jgi:hypothetical protein
VPSKEERCRITDLPKTTLIPPIVLVDEIVTDDLWHRKVRRWVPEALRKKAYCHSRRATQRSTAFPHDRHGYAQLVARDRRRSRVGLNDGRLAEEGSHHDLLTASTVYSRLCSSVFPRSDNSVRGLPLPRR